MRDTHFLERVEVGTDQDIERKQSGKTYILEKAEIMTG